MRDFQDRAWLSFMFLRLLLPSQRGNGGRSPPVLHGLCPAHIFTQMATLQPSSPVATLFYLLDDEQKENP